jgi:hypothetical protein
MKLIHPEALARRFAGDRSTRLSLEQLEARDVPAVGATVAASAIVHSTESYVNMVTADYRQFLGRAPDAGGLNLFVAQLQNGVSQAVIDAEFVSSNEYIANHGNTANGFVQGLYDDLLGRTPSTLETNFWISELAAGATAGQVALGFTTSSEREAIIVNNDFFTLLGRAPDAAGFNFFVNALQSGATRADVESAIIGSNEYVARHGNNSTSFITSVYQNVLNRTPSTAEVGFWTTLINNNGGL